MTDKYEINTKEDMLFSMALGILVHFPEYAYDDNTAAEYLGVEIPENNIYGNAILDVFKLSLKTKKETMTSGFILENIKTKDSRYLITQALISPPISKEFSYFLYLLETVAEIRLPNDLSILTNNKGN